MNEGIVFWADAGTGVGLGHVARSSAIARELWRMAECPLFAIPDALGRVAAEGTGVSTAVMPFAEFSAHAQRASVAVLDSYRLEVGEIEWLRRAGSRIALLDDTADRVLPADLVINGAAGAERLDYASWNHARLLLGPRYAPLREPFRGWPAKSIGERIERVLVTAGGEDLHELLPTFTAAARSAFPAAAVLAACGSTRPALAATADVHYAPSDYPKLVRESDVMVCGGGQTLVEAIATGTPAVAVLLGEDQQPQVSALVEAGTCVSGGTWRMPQPELNDHLVTALVSLRPPARRLALSTCGRALIDGEGAARLAAEILKLVGDQRP